MTICNPSYNTNNFNQFDHQKNSNIFFVLLQSVCKKVLIFIFSYFIGYSSSSFALLEPIKINPPKNQLQESANSQLQNLAMNNNKSSAKPPLIFDLPVTYNKSVQAWIQYFQSTGKKNFKVWLERSHRYINPIKAELEQRNMPLDLAYMAMIESGFSPFAVSTASAVGPWQFIKATAQRYGLVITPWIDERKDYSKSTVAAIRYMSDLYKQFGSWYLVAASYNMGEYGLNRIIERNQIRDFWLLCKMNLIPEETQQYVPKLVAAMIIAKSPALYGFRDLDIRNPLPTEVIWVPGGTNINELADFLGITRDYIKELNPSIIKAYIPDHIRSYAINIPKGARYLVSQFLSHRQEILFVD